MTTGQKIYNLRKEARITQEEFAEKMEVSRQAVSKWESDVSYPETDKIIKIASLFNVSCDYLLKDDFNEQPSAQGKRNRSFLSMMISFSLSLVAVGFIVALICYYSINHRYCSLIGLGVYAGMLLAAFILWSVGRYKFLANCVYSAEDKSYLAKWTKTFIYFAVISAFCYLPTVVFIELTHVIYIDGLSSIEAYYILPFGVYLLTLFAFAPLGISVAKLLSVIHDKYINCNVSRLQLADCICNTTTIATFTIAFSVSAYMFSREAVNEWFGYSYKYFESLGVVNLVIFCCFIISAAILIAQAYLHKKAENTPVKAYVFQLLCPALLILNILCYVPSFYLSSPVLEIIIVINYVLGGLLAINAVIISVSAIKSAIKKDYSQINLARLSLPASIFALIQIVSLYGNSINVLLIWSTCQCVALITVSSIGNSAIYKTKPSSLGL